MLIACQILQVTLIQFDYPLFGISTETTLEAANKVFEGASSGEAFGREAPQSYSGRAIIIPASAT
ncbi:hypothetical protein [Bradyrhizobium valentinum]|uniref:hypothetical protein n=1 Tax=Bradyrhizobium valentinum TaxID=1518501 RepID=UPI0012E39AC9|nr:hypothetical protein [Bradyrhizobium valentinum]